MGLRLLVDEDSQARALVGLLRSRGHDVLTAAEAGLAGKDDASVLAFARDDRRVLLTRNAADFFELHGSHPDHCGVLAIYQSIDPGKNMSYADIVRSITNLERSGVDLNGQFAVLNAWQH